MAVSHVISISLAFIFAIGSVAARDHFTEEFNGDFDLGFTTFTFKPDRSSNGYAVCRSAASAFPTMPTNGVTIVPSTLLVGTGLPLFGHRYRYVVLNVNDSITYGDSWTPGDLSADITISNHFRLPRVSPFLGTLGTGVGHVVYYQSLSNRIALSWIEQPDGTGTGSNSVQLELFYDGVIRLTFLRMDAARGIVGLSRGGGIPGDFSESNLSALGCAGEALYELLWGALPSTAQVGQPFAASLSGRDAFNLAFPVHGPARLGAGRPGTVVFHTDFEQGVGGFTFTNDLNASSNGWRMNTYRGNQLGHSPSNSMHFGSTDATGSHAPSTAGFLVSPVLDLREVYPPVTLSFSHLLAGPTVWIEVREEGQGADSIAAVMGSELPVNTSNRWIRSDVDLSFFAGRKFQLIFNASTLGGAEAWLVDDITITGTTSSIPVAPSVTGLFTGNTWSGNVSIGSPGPGTVLIAAHSNGVYGLSAPINVSQNDDLILAAVATRAHLLIGSTGSINVLVSNTGPNVANSVIVTNVLPANVALGNVAVSQGSASVAGQQLLLNFGSIASSGQALASFEFTVNAGGTLSFTSTVARAGSEAFLENNRAVNTLHAGEPIVSVTSTAASEGATNMVFPLQLDAPSPLPVSVRFTTISGLAIAGEDFVGTNSFVTFPPFATNAEVRIRIIDDNLFEVRPFEPRTPFNDDPEYFTLQLTAVTNATLATATARGTIQENEPVPQLLVAATNLAEGNVGTNLFPVVFRLSGPAAATVDVSYYTETGLGFHQEIPGGNWLFGTAISSDMDPHGPRDFVRVPASGFHFAPGETQRVAYIEVLGDTTPEPDESFTVITTSPYLRRPLLGSPRPPRFTFTEMTIVDDDPPVFSVDDFRVTAENCGTNNGALDPGETVTVLLRVRNVGYNACTSSNLSAVLLTGGGVVNPSGPQSYGAMCGGGPEVWRAFTFTVAAACGENVTATLAFSEHGTNIGSAALQIPVGQRGRAFSETFDAVTVPNLPAGWLGETFGDVPWITTNEPPDTTNQFVRMDSRRITPGAVRLTSPGFVTTSSNAWLRLRHRFEISSIGAAASVHFVTDGGGNSSSTNWQGSSRGWMFSTLPLPHGWVGSTQNVQFQVVRLGGGNIESIWEIDSMEIVDGPALCCDSGAPYITAIQRTDSSVILRWAAVSNRSYQVQFKPSLAPAQAWSDVGAAIVARGPVAAQTNLMSSSNGFFRVRRNN